MKLARALHRPGDGLRKERRVIRGHARLALWAARETTPEACGPSRAKARPALLEGRPVGLDFARLGLCAQSWLHALLFEPMRLARAMRVPIHVVDADPAVREGLRFLEAYALGG